jgi:hypothetical protein
MFRKTFMALIFGALMAATSAPAQADVDITINLGYGGFYGRNISCTTGARIVDRRFNGVTMRNCRGRYYDYTGRRNGKWYYVQVNASTGRIAAVRRWYR